MHPVIKNILARKNSSIPVDDGRHITLVLPSGVMAGVRGGAALIALSDMGLAHVFDSIFTVSAGFPNASYMLSNQARLGASIYYEELASKKFINFKRFWKVADIDYAVDVVKTKKPLDVGAVFKSKTKLYVRLMNEAKDKDYEYIEIHDTEEKNYFDLMKAAVAIPVMYRGNSEVNKNKYHDAGFGDYYLDNFEYAWDAGATDILVINNLPEQDLGYLPKWDSICQIDPEPLWKFSRFEIRPDVLKWEITRFGSLVKSIFGDDEPFKL
jgi:predicted patatin/cPLA2 family phospholipase